ncbi:MAG TPA: DUF2935 domain-containing protein [Clostridia bacterium]|nr:DUF2935 domain-containing protein [Clostridia bacterium]
MSELRKDIVFWLGIMRDHAMFQTNAFTVKEMSCVQTSMYYKNYFQNAIKKFENCKNLEEEMLSDLLSALESFIEYKKGILRSLLMCNIQMNFPPTLINHQINEAMEFRHLFMMPEESIVDTPAELASQIKIWLADASGHAAGLMSFLDPAEALITTEVQMFKEKFDKLLIKASELEMMLNRVGLYDGALMLLAEETIEWLENFTAFLGKFKELRTKCKVLGNGTLSPLIPDHFMREHMYFVSKIKAYMASIKKRD